MNSLPKVKAVMTAFPYSVSIDASVSSAKSMMDEHRIHHLPVIDDGALVGLVTARDLEQFLQATGDAGDPTRLGDPNGLSQAERLRVRAVGLRETLVVEMNLPLDVVLREMAERHLGSVLVVKDGRLAGIFTATDACRLFADFLGTAFPGGGDEVA